MFFTNYYALAKNNNGLNGYRRVLSPYSLHRDLSLTSESSIPFSDQRCRVWRWERKNSTKLGSSLTCCLRTGCRQWTLELFPSAKVRIIPETPKGNTVFSNCIGLTYFQGGDWGTFRKLKFKMKKRSMKGLFSNYSGLCKICIKFNIS